MKCSCGAENKPDAVFCVSCGKEITTAEEESPATEQPNTAAAQPMQAPPAAQAPPAPKTPQAPPQPPQMQQPPQAQRVPMQAPLPAYPPPPYYPPAFMPRRPEPFTLTDVFVIIAFVLAIFGIFVYAYVLLTASIVFSVVGWRRKTNRRTNSLAVAALIIGICAAVIKIGSTLNRLGFIPEWLSSGIFW